MKNEDLVKNWIEFSDMDANLAEFVFAKMHPKPLELICYHCQQSAEKVLKALIIASSDNVTEAPKTHDLALLADILSEQFEITDKLYDACSDLTPYGIKIRYPKQITIDEDLTKKALYDQRQIASWVKGILEKTYETTGEVSNNKKG